jgi:ureidoglycolate dehydrogenase (NAD+)
MTRISISNLEELICNAWMQVTNAENAGYISQAVVRAALQKDDRLNPISGTVKDVEKFAAAQNRTMTRVSSNHSSAVYDLNGCPGIVFMKAIQHEAESIAKKCGISAIGIRNSSGVHELSSWVELPPTRGFIAIFAWNGGSYTTVPYGSREPFFGTNPIAYGIPTQGEPIILDMATSEIPFVSLNTAISRGNSIPLNSGMDPDGQITSNPNEVYKPTVNEDVRLLPMGAGYKGSAIMLLLEVLTGALVGAKMSREATDDPWVPEEFGGLYICIDPSRFASYERFIASVTNMVQGIRQSMPAAGFDEVMVPGDRSRVRERSMRKEDSIEVSGEILAKLGGTAKST